ncbi:hypothetical protein NE237_018297 [Protea cynaroides]|uniref:Uncharacterized protein n=1 Tax=Protea cynaroides TaxID=273540 RepID=A0A9Q0QNV8_9MAGN|nr:hypothetical protein NE237_018297 [Protea cynaroides]
MPRVICHGDLKPFRAMAGLQSKGTRAFWPGTGEVRCLQPFAGLVAGHSHSSCRVQPRGESLLPGSTFLQRRQCLWLDFTPPHAKEDDAHSVRIQCAHPTYQADFHFGLYPFEAILAIIFTHATPAHQLYQ